ncbi:hypothetical protein EVA_11401 [gut metagenome]|uniref:Uncharacterized protein n=1 Tax=gut metagenome TaxID=749906 RepID=J9G0Y9_9ZZZZ
MNRRRARAFRLSYICGAPPSERVLHLLLRAGRLDAPAFRRPYDRRQRFAARLDAAPLPLSARRRQALDVPFRAKFRGDPRRQKFWRRALRNAVNPEGC